MVVTVRLKITSFCLLWRGYRYRGGWVFVRLELDQVTRGRAYCDVDWFGSNHKTHSLYCDQDKVGSSYETWSIL